MKILHQSEYKPAKVVGGYTDRILRVDLGKQEIRETMKLLASGKVNVKSLISHVFPLDNIMEAFEVQTRPEQSIKVIIKP